MAKTKFSPIQPISSNTMTGGIDYHYKPNPKGDGLVIIPSKKNNTRD